MDTGVHGTEKVCVLPLQRARLGVRAIHLVGAVLRGDGSGIGTACALLFDVHGQPSSVQLIDCKPVPDMRRVSFEHPELCNESHREPHSPLADFDRATMRHKDRQALAKAAHIWGYTCRRNCSGRRALVVGINRSSLLLLLARSSFADTLHAAGSPHPTRHAGLRAIIP